MKEQLLAIHELTKYELESLEKSNEYYNEKLSKLEEFTKKSLILMIFLLQKCYLNKNAFKEIKRLRGLVVKYKNANKRSSSTSLN